MKKFVFWGREHKEWDWNIEAVKACPAEENVVEFLIRNMEQLSVEAIKLLSLGACIGSQFGLAALSVLSEKTAEIILSELKQAVSLEIIYAMPSETGQKSETDFVFSHDRFQQTFYTILPDWEKNIFIIHWQCIVKIQLGEMTRKLSLSLRITTLKPLAYSIMKLKKVG